MSPKTDLVRDPIVPTGLRVRVDGVLTDRGFRGGATIVLPPMAELVQLLQDERDAKGWDTSPSQTMMKELYLPVQLLRVPDFLGHELLDPELGVGDWARDMPDWRRGVEPVCVVRTFETSVHGWSHQNASGKPDLTVQNQDLESSLYLDSDGVRLLSANPARATRSTKRAAKAGAGFLVAASVLLDPFGALEDMAEGLDTPERRSIADKAESKMRDVLLNGRKVGGFFLPWNLVARLTVLDKFPGNGTVTIALVGQGEAPRGSYKWLVALLTRSGTDWAALAASVARQLPGSTNAVDVDARRHTFDLSGEVFRPPLLH